MWSDVVCPWCYLGKRNFEQALRQFGHRDAVDVEQRAAEAGLTFRMKDLRSGSTRDAHRLLQLARERGLQAELIPRLYRAYFSEQDSVFDQAALSRLATEAGLDPSEVASVLGSDRFGAEVTADERTAHALGATGVPFFVIDRRYGISVAQPAEVIGRALGQAWSDHDG